MPRKNRFETVCDGSIHHITQRGINRGRIFKTNEDYSSFKSLIKRYLDRFQIKIYNYCLMPNHIHILLLTGEAAHLSKFMQAVSLSYGAYYRKRYKYTGYLWQGRFKNIHIDNDSYLLECARYIERNPLRTKYKMVENLSEFKWSSYNFYANGKADDIITVNPLYESLGKTAKEKQAKYKEYILTPRPYEKVLDDVFRV
jgi:putative transposase